MISGTEICTKQRERGGLKKFLYLVLSQIHCGSGLPRRMVCPGGRGERGKRDMATLFSDRLPALISFVRPG